MALITINLDFRKYRDHHALVEDLSPVFSATMLDEVYVTIDLQTDSNMLYSDHLLMVVAALHFLRSNSIPVTGIIKANPDDHKIKYASRVNFFKEVGFEFDEKFQRHDATGRFTEIRSYTRMDIYALFTEINKILYANTTISIDVLQLFYYCLYEIMDNVLEHSAITTGWVCAQYFEANAEIRLIICDTGQGIHRSLVSNPEYQELNEEQALNKCIHRGVTKGNGLGFGLFATSEFVKANHGDLMIYSGGHFLIMNDKNIQVNSGSPWNGTLVFLRINTNIPVNYKDIMPNDHALPDDYQEFVEKHFGISNELW
ncbi:MAG: ATP-binding protein [Saprospiraceae bacterium]|uniref:ATP-binding protein n=1 Tax=Candidatus Opimibacter skivensis TaxID=2982028 RepID=A0A9D7XQ35_9BACT|nr:ATP-binding protein [Candidatus Opimibacter skivensis]